jgi:hypothetical protein
VVNNSRPRITFGKEATDSRQRLFAGSRGRMHGTSECWHLKAKAPADHGKVWLGWTTPCGSIRESRIANLFPDPRKYAAIAIVKHSHQMFHSASTLYAYTILLIYTVFGEFQDGSPS